MRNVWIVLILVFLRAGAVAEAAPVLSLSQYKSQLQSLLKITGDDDFDAAKAKAAAESLPEKWVVNEQGKSFEISLQWLKRELPSVRDEDDSKLEGLNARLQDLLDEAEAFEKEAPDLNQHRAKLDQILARREFHSVQAPNWWERLKAWAMQRLFDLISRIFGATAFPIVSRVVVWVLVAFAVLVLAFLAYRIIKNNARLESVVPVVEPVSAKSWSTWMQEAHAAAERGDWRESIHLSYWAGISLLEGRGLWRPDRARTPREYLRMLPAENEAHPLLRQLTRRFEVIWYGYQRADDKAFQDSVADLERLGCK